MDAMEEYRQSRAVQTHIGISKRLAEVERRTRDVVRRIDASRTPKPASDADDVLSTTGFQTHVRRALIAISCCKHYRSGILGVLRGVSGRVCCPTERSVSSQRGVSQSLYTALRHVLEGVMMRQARDATEFYVDDDAFPLTSLYFGHDDWLSSISSSTRLDDASPHDVCASLLTLVSDYDRLLADVVEVASNSSHAGRLSSDLSAVVTRIRTKLADIRGQALATRWASSSVLDAPAMAHGVVEVDGHTPRTST
jgi:hypothetical protein